ncbi:LuxR C-terminal-related transcriptional regulator [Nocardioides antri]|uniref:Response regulator transcription factor n=1 Tax=Nocardioides antri TaxID=2607659 RepID=A0A5B1LZF5_9ACTN|nr:response regulator transcription factor [Nocardioides antri]KAA1425578.1 response regulator transcription factor [Nocardioides antri]
MSDESPVRIVVADADAGARAVAVAALVANGCDVCGEAGSRDEVVAVAVEQRPDVVLLDVDLPGHALTAARELARRLPTTALVMIASTADDEELLDSLRAGAAGYLLKDTDPDRLGFALRGVLNGEAAIPRQLVRRLTEELRSPALPKFVKNAPAAAKLTAREWQVMELLGEGLTTDQVARRLFLSRSTVRVHVSAALRKLRVDDRESAFAVLRGEGA